MTSGGARRNAFGATALTMRPCSKAQFMAACEQGWSKFDGVEQAGHARGRIADYARGRYRRAAACRVLRRCPRVVLFDDSQRCQCRRSAPWIACESGAVGTRGEHADSSAPKEIMPPIGKPPPTPLAAKVTMSGSPPERSSRWKANHAPVRPMRSALRR